MTLTLSIKRVRHLEYTEEIYRTEFPYSDIGTTLEISLYLAKFLHVALSSGPLLRLPKV